MIRRIIISGEGGQGIKLVSHVLGSILVDLNYEVSITYDYDTAVRGGKIVAFLTYSDEKIENPLIEKPDLLLKFSNLGGDFVAHKVVCEAGICKEKVLEKNEERIHFQKIAEEKFGHKIIAGMIALGRLLKLIDIDISKANLKGALPQEFLEKNIEAITYGYACEDFS